MRDNTTLRPSRRFARFSIAILAAVAFALVACEGQPGDGTATQPGVTSTANETASVTPQPSPTVSASPSASASPSPSPTRTSTPGSGTGQFGAVAVDVETGEAATLSTGPWLIVDAHRPHLTTGGTAMWISTEPDEASRYALDGSVTETVPGWSPVESQDGRSRAYLVGGEDFRTAATVVVEREGLTVREVQTAGGQPRMTFSPDGMRFAWIDWSVGEGVGDLKVLDIETGDVRTVATGIGRCQCDVPQHSTWSPSGAYLAFQRPGSTAGVVEHGVAVVSLEGEDETLIDGATLAPRSWVSIDGVEWLLTVGPENRVRLTAPAADETTRELVRVEDASVRAAIENSLVVVRTQTGREEHQTLVFDPASGERLVVLDGEGDVVLTPDGMATAVITRTELACTGLDIKHPAYEAQLPCDVSGARWAPDGRYLALLPVQEGAPLRILDVTTGDQREVDQPGFGGLPEWSSDSRYIVWVWGGGP